MCVSVHIDVYKNVWVCVCVLQAEGSPAGPRLLRPDQTMRRGAAWCGTECSGGVCSSLQSRTWPRAATK